MDEYLYLDYNGLPCACRCRHCLLGTVHPSRRITLARLKRVAERFLAWRETSQRTALQIGLTICFYGALPRAELLDYLAFLQRHAMPGNDYLPMNGLRILPRDALLTLFTALRDGGVRTVNLTFYGDEAYHDHFAGRRGDFRYLLTIAEVLAAVGLQRSETLFLAKPSLAELPGLLTRLDAIPGLSARALGPWDYQGRAIQLEHERPEDTDLAALPEAIRGLLNTTRFRTEADWVNAMTTGASMEKRWRIYYLAIDDASIDTLETQDCEALFTNLSARHAVIMRQQPPQPMLA